MAVGSGSSVETIIQIIGEDKISHILSNVETSFKDILKQAKKNEKLTEKYGKTMGKVVGKVSQMKDTWLKVATPIESTINIVGQISNAVSGMVDKLREAAQERGIAARFDAITASVGGATNAMGALRAASAGAVDDTSLQQIGASALQAGISLGETAELVDLATRAASAGMGEQTDLTKRFISAISERSDGLFRQMGLELDFGQILGKTAMKMGVSADAMSEGTKRAVILREVMPKLHDAFDEFSTDTAVQQIGRFDAAMANLESKAKEMALIKLMDDDDPKVDALRGTIDMLATSTENLNTANLDTLFGAKQNVAAVHFRELSLKKLRVEVDKHPAGIILLKNKIQEMAQDFANADPSIDGISDRLERNAARAQFAEKRSLDLARAMGVLDIVGADLTDDQEALNKAMGVSSDKLGEAADGTKKLSIEEKALEEQRKLNHDAAISRASDAFIGGKNALSQANALSAGWVAGLPDVVRLTQAVGLYKKALDAGSVVGNEFGDAQNRMRFEAARMSHVQNELTFELIQQAIATASGAAATTGYGAQIQKLTGFLSNHFVDLSNHKRLIAEIAVLTGKQSETTAEYATAQARLFKAQGLTTEATAAYKSALDSGVLSVEEMTEAYIHIEIAQQKQAAVDQEAVLLQAMVARGFGNTRKAAELYKQAIGKMPTSASLANVSLHDLGQMAKVSGGHMGDAAIRTLELERAQIQLARSAAEWWDLGTMAALEKRAAALEKREAGLRGRLAKTIVDAAAPKETGAGAKRDTFEEIRTEAAARIIKEMEAAGSEAQLDEVRAKWDETFHLYAAGQVQRFDEIFAEEMRDLKFDQLADEMADAVTRIDLERLSVDASRLELTLAQDEKLADAKVAAVVRLVDIEKEGQAAILEIQRAAASESLSNALSTASSLGDISAQGLGALVSGSVSEFDRWSDMHEEMQAIAKATGAAEVTKLDVIKKAAPGAIAMSGKVAAAFVDDEQVQARILGFTELAASVAAFGWGDPKAGVLHALSSTMYFAAASMSKKGSGAGSAGGGKEARPASLNQLQQPGQGAAPKQVTINFSGTVVGNDEQAARSLATMIRKEMRWGAPGSGGQM